jgi:hypothetical protein
MSLSPGTLLPAEVARNFIDAGITKHRTRIDVIFLKAVRPLPAFANSTLMCGVGAVCGRRVLVFWRAAIRGHLGWFAVTDRFKPGHSQNSWWIRLPRGPRDVSPPCLVLPVGGAV